MRESLGEITGKEGGYGPRLNRWAEASEFAREQRFKISF